MPQEVQVGTILMSECSQLFGLESEPYSGDWRVVKALDGFAFDRKIRAAGWNFCFIASEVSEVKVMFFRRACGEEDAARIESDFRQGESATLQCP